VRAFYFKKEKMSTSIVKAKTFAEFWAAIPFPVKLLIWALLLFLAYLAYRGISNWWKAKKQQDLLQNNNVTTTFIGAGGQPIVQTVDLGTKAAAIDNAFYNNDWFGASEDENAAITNILGVPKSLIPDLSNVYFKLNGKNLKQDFQKFLSDTDYLKVSDLFS